MKLKERRAQNELTNFILIGSLHCIILVLIGSLHYISIALHCAESYAATVNLNSNAICCYPVRLNSKLYTVVCV